MARIRTIKPEFFTSDDICALSPLARLLYIGLWCEADREGRLVWTPRVFKRRYLPDDACDADQVADELLARGLVVLYGDGLALIPTFPRHQHLNPREAVSKLAAPDDARADAGAASASDPVIDASARVGDAQGGREGEEKGKGKKGEGREDASATRRARGLACALPEDWTPDDTDLAWAKAARPDLSPELIAAETERFRNHALANARTAHRWGPNWRNWIARAHAWRPDTPRPDAPMSVARARGAPATVDRDSDQHWRARLRGYRPGGFWLEGDWGPRPESGRSRVPRPILADWQGAKDAGGAQDAKGARTAGGAQGAGGPRIAGDARGAQDAGGARTAEGEPDARGAQDSGRARDAKAPRETEDGP
ncbi:MAG: hypothetical protein JSR91_05090 [Proteobacteria bacterium]|nr:hypothetical protein [Pseudomonadota bacterium]